MVTNDDYLIIGPSYSSLKQVKICLCSCSRQLKKTLYGSFSQKKTFLTKSGTKVIKLAQQRLCSLQYTIRHIRRFHHTRQKAYSPKTAYPPGFKAIIFWRLCHTPLYITTTSQSGSLEVQVFFRPC